jgi:hypothetical protein
VSVTANRASLISLILTTILYGACGAPGPVVDIKPGERPALDTTEAGLWTKMDEVE